MSSTQHLCFHDHSLFSLVSDSILYFRTLFRVNRFWPAFSGAKIQGDKETERGNLPVLLWPEQRRYLDAVGGIGTPQMGSRIESNTVITKKRKHNEVSDSENGTTGGSVSTFSQDSTALAVSSPYTSGSEAGVIPEVRGYTNPTKRRRGAMSSILSGLIDASISVVQSIATFVGFGGQSDTLPSVLSHEEQRYLVFKDLHEKGFFIGPADVYGGDYNIYKGDPSNSHSLATIRVVYHGKVSGRDVLAFSRVQNQVAKSAVFAYVTPNKEQKVGYTVMNFQAVSDRM